jgi:hypothetical protein
VDVLSVLYHAPDRRSGRPEEGRAGRPVAHGRHPHPTRVQAPEACLEAAAPADEVISRLNRNERDNRLANALRDYTIASQACRRAASP